MVCLPLPMYHAFAMVVGSIGSHSIGASIVFPHPAYSGLDTLKAMSEENCTTMFGVPTMYADVCREQ